MNNCAVILCILGYCVVSTHSLRIDTQTDHAANSTGSAQLSRFDTWKKHKNQTQRTANRELSMLGACSVLCLFGISLLGAMMQESSEAGKQDERMRACQLYRFGSLLSISFVLVALAGMAFPEDPRPNERQSISERTLAKVTAAEVAQHTSSGDSWTIIDGVVYDISAFAFEHSGGNLIMQAAGRDATAYFHTNHPASAMLHVKRVLKEFVPRVGILSPADGVDMNMTSDPPAEYFSYRMSEELKDLPRRPWGPQIAVHVNLVLYAVSFHQAFVKGSMLGALSIGAMSTIIENTIHVVSHKMIFEPKGIYSNVFLRWVTTLSSCSGWTYTGTTVSEGYKDECPLAHFMPSSVVHSGVHFGHHSLAGNDHEDPEVLYVRKPFFWELLRTDPDEELKPYHQYQHLFALPMAILVTLMKPFKQLIVAPVLLAQVSKQVLLSDAGIAEKLVGLLRLFLEMSLGLAFTSPLFFPWIAFKTLSRQRVFLILLVMSVSTSLSPYNVAWSNGLMHWIEAADPHDRCWNDRNTSTWFARTVENSVDIPLFGTPAITTIDPSSTISLLWFWANDWGTLGGWAFQAIHHVAPALSPAYYPVALKIMEETRSKFQLKYNNMNYFRATMERISFLRDLSQH